MRSRKVIRTARDAAEALVEDWPLQDGEEFYDAVKTCLDGISGESEPNRLRQAIGREACKAGITAITIIHDQRGTDGHKHQHSA